MKKFITFLFSLSVLFHLSGVVNAQSRGVVRGQAPTVNQGHASTGPRELPAQSRADQHGTQAPVERQDHHQAWQTSFQERMQSNAALRTRIEGLLPAGTDFETAASGFKNRGQFIAALHVSENLMIPFDQLKATVLGLNTTTLQAQSSSSPNPKSLGEAIHELRPDLTESQVQVEVKKAGREAKETEKTTTTTS